MAPKGTPKGASKRALENVERAQNKKPPGPSENLNVNPPPDSATTTNSISETATDTSTIVQPKDTPATDDVCTTAHGGTTDSGGDNSAQSDDAPLSQTATSPEVPLRDRLRKRPEPAKPHDAEEDEDEDEFEDEDEDGRVNKGKEESTPSKPPAVGDKRGRGRPYKSTTPQGLPPTYHILLHSFYSFLPYHLGLRAFKSPVSDIGYSSDPAIAAQEEQETMMLKQYVSDATWDMEYYPEGHETPNPFMFWGDKHEAPAYALIKRYAFFFMSCFMYVFSAVGCLNAYVRPDMKKKPCLFMNAYA